MCWDTPLMLQQAVYESALATSHCVEPQGYLEVRALYPLKSVFCNEDEQF